ncbi:MAG: ribonuclease Z [Ruminococcus sp.]|nr:ribonuclease Z [Ruminococcus sp.]MDE7226126.1 ribonuclease Z [Ruminococcus sp.]
MIDVTLVGTGGMLPLPERWLTCMWLEYNGKACLTDCGEGTQIALRKHGLKLSRLDAVLITHFHADHVAGLAGLLLSLGNCGKTDSLKIYGGKGTAQIIKNLCCICPFLPFEIEIHELPFNEQSEFSWNGITIKSLPLKHSISCLGYSFTLERKPVFLPEKARMLGIDVKYWNRLHSGNSVEINGKTITPEMVTGEHRRPVKITYITDSLYFDKMAEFASDSNLLISEGMYGDDEYKEKMAEKGHMVFSQSAELAKKSGSELLWLTHYSPALTNPQEYSDMIKSIFPDTVISRDGECVTLK